MNELPEIFFEDEAVFSQTKNSLYCHVQDHLGEYTSHIVQNILPRFSNEIPQLLTPSKDQNNQWVQVAEKLSVGDLFHGHIRIPVKAIPNDLNKLHPLFYDSKQYHLQYHSFETFGAYTQTWMDELLRLNHGPIEKWLKDVDSYHNHPKGHGGPDNFGSAYDTPAFPLEPLTEKQVLDFSQRWHQSHGHSHPPSNEFEKWQLLRFQDKLKLIDPKISGTGHSVLKNRSVVTDDESFHIITALNLDGYIQPANIYFALRKNHPGFEAVIKKATQAGLNFIINRNNKNFAISQYPAISQWELQDQLMKQAEESFLNHSAPDSIFRERSIPNKGTGTKELNRFQVFTWDDHYIFAIWYAIHCKE